MRHRHLQLRVGRFGQHGEENAEILVRLDSLRQIRRPTLFEKRVGDRQLGLGKILAVRIGVDESLQVQSADLMPPVLDIIHCLVIQNLVGLRGILRTRRLIDPFLLMKDLRIAPRRAQQKQSCYRE